MYVEVKEFATLAAAASHPALDSSLGALLVGGIIGIALYGAMCVQVFCYLQHNFKNDSIWIKSTVFWSLFMETVHTVFITMTLYNTVVTHFGDFTALQHVDWPLSFSVPVSSAISAPIQTFYAFRIWTLSKSPYIPILCFLLSVAKLGLSLADAILSLQVKNLVLFQTKYVGFIVGAVACGIAVDIITTISLCYLLVRSKDSVVKSSRAMIDTLVLWTVETGLLTTISNIISFSLILSMPKLPTWLCPVLFTAKLYSNSLLASLNGRVSLRATSHTTTLATNTFTPSYVVSSDSTTIKFGQQLHSRTGAGAYTGGTEDHELHGRGYENEAFAVKRDPERDLA